MEDFTAPQFCMGFDNEVGPVVWGELDPLAPVLKIVKVAKGKGKLRESTASEKRRCGVLRRFVGSKWYRSSHTACVYPTVKPYRLEDTYRAIRTALANRLAQPSWYPLTGDGKATAAVREAQARYATAEKQQIALIEARYADWLAVRDRDAQITMSAAPEFLQAA